MSDEWQHFFASLQEERRDNGQMGGQEGPSSARPLEQLDSRGDREVLAALTGDYGAAEQRIRNRIEARAVAGGVDLSPIASLRATQDSIRALMLIRAYRAMGHLVANLDPLGLAERKKHRELRPRLLRLHGG